LLLVAVKGVVVVLVSNVSVAEHIASKIMEAAA
jgi:hypothetical protein